MTYYVQSGSAYKIADSNTVVSILPPGNFTVKKDPYDNIYLDRIQDFTRPSRIYGDTERTAARILNTFSNRKGTTGVLLAGEKGSGKTLLAKMISIDAAKAGMPTIVINEPWCGENFNQFIQSIDQPCVMVFDEFEKIYERDDQMRILTLLDGVYSSKKLIILTVNNKYAVDTHFINRPGRLYYMLDFDGLEISFVREYCAENLKNKAHTEAVVRLALTFMEFNFDMLQSLIEEMNRYDESPQEALKFINVKPFMANNAADYEVNLVVDGKPIPKELLIESCISARPLLNDVFIELRDMDESEDDMNDGAIAETPLGLVGAESVARSYSDDTYAFRPDNIVSIDADTQTYKYINDDGDVLVLKREYYKRQIAW